MDELTAKLRARDRAEWREGVANLRRFVARARRVSRGSKYVDLHALAMLVFAAHSLHVARGTAHLTSTKLAVARYVF